MIQNFVKYFPWATVLLALCALCFYYWRENQLAIELLKTKNSELMQANLELGKAHSQIVSSNLVKKQLEEELKASDKKLLDIIGKHNSLISMYGKLEAELKTEKKKVKTLTQIVYKEKVLDIPKNKLFYLDDNGKYQPLNEIRYSYNDFRISIQGEALSQTLSYQLHQKFKAHLIETKLPNGVVNHYAKVYEIDDKGKEIAELKLTSFEVLKAKDLENKMFWINPKIDIGMGGGIALREIKEIKPLFFGEIGFSLSTYGKTPDDTLFRFIRIGIGGTNEGFSVTASPIQINLGKFLPIISNLYLTPIAGFNFNLNAPSIGLGLSVVL